MFVVDVRNASELQSGYIENALNISLIEICKLAQQNKLSEKIPTDKQIYLHCKSGLRSLMAWSVLRRNGYVNHVNIERGYDAIKLENHHLRFIE
jgi:rhodanese-related sulfurtransferase